MSSPVANMQNFGQFLSAKSIMKFKKMEAVLHIIENINPPNMRYEFCLVRCDKNQIREDDFVQFLYESIADYTLPYAELHPKKLTKEKLHQYIVDNTIRLASKATSTFITKAKNTGELGELFLFVALESKGFIRLLNKMALKTSSEIPFQGWDAVHIGVDNKDNILFCYGSSKMYADFSKGLNEAISEIANFANDRKKEEHEINLVASFIDQDRFGKYSKEITKLLSPYYRDKDKLGRMHAAFLGYEWIDLRNAQPSENCTLDDSLVAKYQGTHQETIRKIEGKLPELGAIKSRDFLFWILPFADLDVLRQKFRTKLGVPNLKSEECNKT